MSAAQAANRVATDVGGTFTDLVYLHTDPATGRQHITTGKADTTPPNFEQGVLDVVARSGLNLGDVGFLVHGTTVVINALTERKGAVTGLITTEGFRDVLEIARGNRPDFFNLFYRKPPPFVPRRLRREVPGRLAPDGTERAPLDLDGLDAIVDDFRGAGVEAVAICLLHAYANPAHEEAVADQVRQLWPEVSVVASHEITREWREYERTSTAVLSAYVQPVADRYLGRLAAGLSEGGFGGRPYVMQSNCGVDTLDHARRIPITMVESGPASGFWGAAELGRLIDEPNVLALDVGGTTAKCSLVKDGQVQIATDYWIERNRQSAGYPIMVPVVDLVEIGNGGGSIAWVDDFGKLHVGPQSAGALPGPAAYGLGGTDATTTDAHVALGRINPHNFRGGGEADLAANRQALTAVAERLGRGVSGGATGRRGTDGAASADGSAASGGAAASGGSAATGAAPAADGSAASGGAAPSDGSAVTGEVTAVDAARGIVRIADANMINALKLVSVNRGHDPRDFTLVAFGGGGGLHAASLAAELGMRRVVIPAAAGVFSAWGMLMSDLRRDLIVTRLTSLRPEAAADVAAWVGDMEEEAYAQFEAEDIGRDRVRIDRWGRLRYENQEHSVEVALPEGTIDAAAVSELIEEFHAQYEREYTYRLDAAVELVAVHLVARADVGRISPQPLDLGDPDPTPARTERRTVDFDLAGVHESDIYAGDRLQPGMRFTGPAIVEGDVATTVIRPGDTAHVDAYGNLIIDLATSPSAAPSADSTGATTGEPGSTTAPANPASADSTAAAAAGATGAASAEPKSTDTPVTTPATAASAGSSAAGVAGSAGAASAEPKSTDNPATAPATAASVGSSAAGVAGATGAASAEPKSTDNPVLAPAQPAANSAAGAPAQPGGDPLVPAEPVAPTGAVAPADPAGPATTPAEPGTESETTNEKEGRQ